MQISELVKIISGILPPNYVENQGILRVNYKSSHSSFSFSVFLASQCYYSNITYMTNHHFMILFPTCLGGDMRGDYCENGGDGVLPYTGKHRSQ